MPYHIGILGTARVLPQSIILPALEYRDVTIEGIAGRSHEKSLSLSSKYKIPLTFGSYENMIRDPRIDIVYIALPVCLHYEWALKSIKEGKHVLIEKPICTRSHEIDSLENECLKRQVYIQEGLMTEYHCWQAGLLSLMHEGTYGPLEQIRTTIALEIGADRIKRLPNGNLGGGAFWDLGPYWLQFIQKILGLQACSIGAINFRSQEGKEIACDIILHYPNDIEARFHCSYLEPYQAKHYLVFKNATIEVEDFFRPNLGNYKVWTTVYLNNQESFRVPYGPQSYFKNQLGRFLEGVRRNSAPSLAWSRERIRLMETLFTRANH